MTRAKNGFTLAEVLITLAVLGVVALVTIPGIVKTYNEKTWTMGKTVFTKNLEESLKQMNVKDELSGYSTTSEFVNALKRYIKITKICTDDIAPCFHKEIVWRTDKAPVEVKRDYVFYKNNGSQDWAETVGVQFNNGVTALLAYNKNCSVDKFNNQVSITSECLGIIYDVTGNKKPNTNGKDIDANANVSKLNNITGCAYVMSDGTCFTKILAPGTGYSPFPMEINGTTVTCTQAISKGYIESDYTSCYYGDNDETYDYWAGAQYACGGKKANMPNQKLLYTLAQEAYNTTAIKSGTSSTQGLILDTEKTASFIEQSPNEWFSIWAAEEASSNVFANLRYFALNETDYGSYYRYRNSNNKIAVCIGE